MRSKATSVTIALVVSALIAVACRSGAPASGDSTSTPSPAPGANPTASTPVQSDSVVLRTDKTQYRPGEKVTLRFENKSGSTYGFNPCNRSLEREQGGSWSAVPDAGRICTLELWTLKGGDSVTAATELDAAVTAGRYRIVVRMTPDSPSATAVIRAVSNPITVSAS